MLTFEQIAEEAKAYANITSEQIDAMGLTALHEQLSIRIAAQEEVTASKKAFSASAADLLKRIRGDILCLNREIRARYETSWAARSKESADDELVIELLPDPKDEAAV
jgi:hypothetical protein